MKNRNPPEIDEEILGRDPGHQNPQELPEGHRHRGHRPGLNDQEKGPAVKKSEERPESLAQINVLPAGGRHHACQFAVSHRRRNRHYSADQPTKQKETRGLHLARNVSGHDENPRANHRAHDDGGAIVKAEALDEFRG